MKVIKRNGKEAAFDQDKIFYSIARANKDVPVKCAMPEGRMRLIAKEISEYFDNKKNWADDSVPVGNIRELVETKIIGLGSPSLARHYIIFGAAKSVVK